MTPIVLVLSLSLFAGGAGETVDGTGMRTGMRLLDYCRESQRPAARTEGRPLESIKAAFCLGYISGFSEAEALIASANTDFYCAPDGVTHGQEVLIVLKYLEDNPERLDFPRSILVGAALAEAFPCPPEDK